MHGEEAFEDKGRPRNGNPEFYKLLDEMAMTHDKKSHDYASNSNPSGNYHFAGQMASMFSHSPEDAGFFGRIAEKVYRLANLESGGKTAKNESIEDTERDIAVITILWMVDRRDRRNKPNPLETELFDLIKLMPDTQTQKIIDYIYGLRETRHGLGSIGKGVREVPFEPLNAQAGSGTYTRDKQPWESSQMSEESRRVMEAASRPNQGQPAAMSQEAEEVLRMILMTNNRILHMLAR